MRAILTFHSIDASGSVLSFDPGLFARLLAVLAEQGIPVVDLATLLKEKGAPGVAITFDDGMRSVVENALPVLTRYQAKAHLFLCTRAISSGEQWPQGDAAIPGFDMLNWDDVETLHRSGVAIEGHTHNHPNMRTLSDQQMLDECAQADELIQLTLGLIEDVHGVFVLSRLT